MLSRRRPSSLLPTAAWGLLLFLLIGYILYPALKTVAVSFGDDSGWSLATYRQLMGDAAYRLPIFNSTLLGLLTMAICGLIGTGLAFCLHFFHFPARRILDKLLLLPMMLPGIIIVLAFVQLYGESGMITKAIQSALDLEQPPFRLQGLPGILFVHAYTQYVYFYLSVSIALRHLDRSALEAARSLGASKLQLLRTVILPWLSPALIAASVMTFMTGVGSFTAPSVIGGGYKVLTTQILLAKANNYPELAATQVVVLTIISLALFALFRFYEARARFTSSVKATPLLPVVITGRLPRFLLLGGAALLILLILLPVATIVVLSFVPSKTWMMSYYPTDFSWQNYTEVFSRARKFAPFLNSLIMAVAAAGAGVAIGLPAAWCIARSQSRFRWLVELLTMLPWAMPASAIAINLINAFNQRTVFSFSYILVGTSVLLPLGYLIKSLPMAVRIVTIGLDRLNDTYLEASSSLGASPLQSFIRIGLSLLAPSLLAAFLLVFIRSIGEYTISAFLYNAANKPISIAMVNGVFEYNIGLAMAYGTLLILLTGIMTQFFGYLHAGITGEQR